MQGPGKLHDSAYHMIGLLNKLSLGQNYYNASLVSIAMDNQHCFYSILEIKPGLAGLVLEFEIWRLNGG